ncbi:MAG: UDP-N-acetylmuramate dehydrogenase, partial [Anaerovorax sp.]
AGGIPGSIGGGLFMNAGAYGGEMSQIVKCAKVLSPDGAAEVEIEAAQMLLSYRNSIFQKTGQIILEAQFCLQPDDKTKIGERMREFTARRNEKQPVNLPSAGSFFKRPKGYFAGKLIEDAGLRGLSLGGAQISPLHAGFIVNNGGATAADIINLMEIVQHTVYDRFGVQLLPEVRIIGEQEY